MPFGVKGSVFADKTSESSSRGPSRKVLANLCTRSRGGVPQKCLPLRRLNMPAENHAMTCLVCGRDDGRARQFALDEVHAQGQINHHPVFVATQIHATELFELRQAIPDCFLMDV
jgi:hypothetical protein